MLAEREMLRPREGTTRGHWQCPRLKRLKTLAIDEDNEISRGTEMSPFVGGDIGPHVAMVIPGKPTVARATQYLGRPEPSGFQGGLGHRRQTGRAV